MRKVIVGILLALVLSPAVFADVSGAGGLGVFGSWWDSKDYDALYGGELLPRWFCDWTFYKLLRDLGVPWWKSSLMFVGVRLGGWIVWIFEHDRQSVAAARSHILTRFDRYAPPRFPAREVPRPESQNQTKGTST